MNRTHQSSFLPIAALLVGMVLLASCVTAGGALYYKSTATCIIDGTPITYTEGEGEVLKVGMYKEGTVIWLFDDRRLEYSHAYKCNISRKVATRVSKPQ